MFKQGIERIIGSKVEIRVSDNSQGYFTEKGVVTDLLPSATGLFLLVLDDKKYISSRFIIKIEVID